MFITYRQTLQLFSRDIRLSLHASALLAFFGIYTLFLNLYLLRLGYDPTFIDLVDDTGPPSNDDQELACWGAEPALG